MRYIFYDLYGDVARGIEPTDDLHEAIKSAKNYCLEVYDTATETTLYHPKTGLKKEGNEYGSDKIS